MARWFSKRWVWAALAGAGLTVGMVTGRADGESPPKVGSVMTLNPDGKGDHQYKVMKTEKLEDGSYLSELKDTRTGSTLYYGTRPDGPPGGPPNPAFPKAKTRANDPLLPPLAATMPDPPKEKDKHPLLHRIFGKRDQDPMPNTASGGTASMNADPAADSGKKPGIIARIFGPKKPTGPSMPSMSTAPSNVKPSSPNPPPILPFPSSGLTGNTPMTPTPPSAANKTPTKPFFPTTVPEPPRMMPSTKPVPVTPSTSPMPPIAAPVTSPTPPAFPTTNPRPISSTPPPPPAPIPTSQPPIAPAAPLVPTPAVPTTPAFPAPSTVPTPAPIPAPPVSTPAPVPAPPASTPAPIPAPPVVPAPAPIPAPPASTPAPIPAPPPVSAPAGGSEFPPIPIPPGGTSSTRPIQVIVPAGYVPMQVAFDRDVQPWVISLQTMNAPSARLTAAKALADCRHRSSDGVKSVLFHAAQMDPCGEVRAACITHLCELGYFQPLFLGYIQVACDDTDPMVRDAAKAACEKMIRK